MIDGAKRIVITQIGVKPSWSVALQQWQNDVEEWVELKGTYRAIGDPILVIAYARRLVDSVYPVTHPATEGGTHYGEPVV